MGAPRRTAVRPIAREIGEQTELGELYLTALVRAQRRHAVWVCLTAAVVLGGLPVLFELVPAIGTAHIFGIRLPWLLLGVLAYPFMILLGWRAVVGAERNEQEFAELVQHP
jgi:EamA domain-containing membrane protein RarD